MCFENRIVRSSFSSNVQNRKREDKFANFTLLLKLSYLTQTSLILYAIVKSHTSAAINVQEFITTGTGHF